MFARTELSIFARKRSIHAASDTFVIRINYRCLRSRVTMAAMTSEVAPPTDEQGRVLACLLKLSGGRPGVFHEFGRLASVMRWNGIELGIALSALKGTGDVQVTDDAAALTPQGVTRATSNP